MVLYMLIKASYSNYPRVLSSDNQEMRNEIESSEIAEYKGCDIACIMVISESFNVFFQTEAVVALRLQLLRLRAFHLDLLHRSIHAINSLQQQITSYLLIIRISMHIPSASRMVRTKRTLFPSLNSSLSFDGQSVEQPPSVAGQQGSIFKMISVCEKLLQSNHGVLSERSSEFSTEEDLLLEKQVLDIVNNDESLDIQLLQRGGQQDNKLEKWFRERIKCHIQIKELTPHALTVIGANLLSDGIFHFLWLSLVKKFHPSSFETLATHYYEDFIKAINTNAPIFEQAFRMSNKKISCLECESTFVLEEEEISSSPIQKQQVQLNHHRIDCEIVAIDAFSNRFNQYQMYNRTSEKELSPLVDAPFIDDQDSIFPLNFKLLKTRQSNQRRRAAELACTFFGISPERTFNIQEIQILEIFEQKFNNKSEYIIFSGRKIGESQSFSLKFSQQAKVFISCGRFQGLESFIRIELTYGKIYGFVIMDQIQNQILPAPTQF